ncbi:hypothetical protein DRH27_04465 [Candidatus Falkowbacteria bacterium]|nr:MAG: hypothetical protein DRH27_04465 [Candidatus Falkowbacteria bacterium]
MTRARKRQQGKNRGRPRGTSTVKGTQIFCRLPRVEKKLVLAASRAYDKRTGLFNDEGKLRCSNDWVREQLVSAAEKELAREDD